MIELIDMLRVSGARWSKATLACAVSVGLVSAGLVSAVAPAAVAAPRGAAGADDRAIVAPRSGGRGGARDAIERRGGRVLAWHAPGGFFVVETPRNAPQWTYEVRNDRAVRFAEPDQVVTASAVPNDPSYPSTWGLPRIGAPAAWDTTTGSRSVVVGVIDTGVTWSHTDLAQNIWTNPLEIAGNGVDDDGNGYRDDVRGWDCRNNDNNPTDDNNHGTHVAGTVGAVGNNSTGVAGVSWTVSVMPLKFLSSSGSGYLSDAIECLDYATANGVHLTNNSWGGGGYSTALYEAIGRARAAGDLFVAAAGNDGLDNDLLASYPASYNHDNVVAVAATDANDALAIWSNYGATSVDLAAPGVSILSTVPGGYGYMSGTSMASPHVAGAAAMLWAANGSLTYARVRDVLFSSVDAVAGLNGRVATGGRLNLGRAMSAVAAPTPPPAPGGLTATAASDSAIDLAWADVAGETSYAIQRSSDGSAWNDLASTGADVTAYRDGGLPPSTTFHYRVMAVSSAGSSSPSAPATATTHAAPTGATSVHVGDLDRRAGRASGQWYATVTVTVHDDREQAVGGATVSYSWSNGTAGACVTAAGGTCSATIYLPPSVRRITFTVGGVAHSLPYSGANHDPDGESNGTSINVMRP